MVGGAVRFQNQGGGPARCAGILPSCVWGAVRVPLGGGRGPRGKIEQRAGAAPTPVLGVLCRLTCSPSLRRWCGPGSSSHLPPPGSSHSFSWVQLPPIPWRLSTPFCRPALPFVPPDVYTRCFLDLYSTGPHRYPNRTPFPTTLRLPPPAPVFPTCPMVQCCQRPGEHLKPVVPWQGELSAF